MVVTRLELQNDIHTFSQWADVCMYVCMYVMLYYLTDNNAVRKENANAASNNIIYMAK